MEPMTKLMTFADVNDDDPKSVRRFERELSVPSGKAAAAHLAAGRPIYYADNAIGPHTIREWPDGRREFVEHDEHLNIIVIGPVE